MYSFIHSNVWDLAGLQEQAISVHHSMISVLIWITISQLDREIYDLFL
jgi:hypothetical protein